MLRPLPRGRSARPRLTPALTTTDRRERGSARRKRGTGREGCRERSLPHSATQKSRPLAASSLRAAPEAAGVRRQKRDRRRPTEAQACGHEQSLKSLETRPSRLQTPRPRPFPGTHLHAATPPPARSPARAGPRSGTRARPTQQRGDTHRRGRGRREAGATRVRNPRRGRTPSHPSRSPGRSSAARCAGRAALTLPLSPVSGAVRAARAGPALPGAPQSRAEGAGARAGGGAHGGRPQPAGPWRGSRTPRPR